MGKRKRTKASEVRAEKEEKNWNFFQHTEANGKAIGLKLEHLNVGHSNPFTTIVKNRGPNLPKIPMKATMARRPLLISLFW